jgi:tripartite-type tricarboxylate transporter receptor subunit TctC
MVAKAPPDGYTLLLANTNVSTNQALYKYLPYDADRDLIPVANAIITPAVLVVHPSVPAKNVRELIALAKAQPGKLNFASVGTGSPGHIAGELLKLKTGIDIVHVPYKGGGPAVTDTLGGQVQLLFVTLPAAMQYVKAGKLKALGVTQNKRSFVFPDLPTIGETVKDYDVSLYYGVSGPKGIPADIVETLNKAINIALADPKMQKRIADFGGTPLPMTAAQFGKLVSDETERWAKVVAKIGLSIE